MRILMTMKKILENIKILVTRSKNQSEEFSNKLKSLGAEVTNMPLIDIKPIINNNILNTYKNINIYHWIIFTSTNSIEIFFDVFNKNNLDLNYLENIKFAVVGRKTRDKLLEYGFNTDLCPEVFTADELLKEFIIREIKDNNILIPCSKIAKRDLYNGLVELGNKAIFLEIYDNIEINTQNNDFNISDIDYITFTSPSTVQSFYNIFGNIKLNSKIVSIGTVTSSKVKELMGIDSLVPNEFTIEGMTKIIIENVKDTY